VNNDNAIKLKYTDLRSEQVLEDGEVKPKLLAIDAF
jgi:hypothetical protein